MSAAARIPRPPRTPFVFTMASPTVLPVSVKGVMPTANGCAVFLGDDAKTFVIYVDHAVGNAIQMSLNGEKKERPLTHDLIGHILAGLGATLEHVVINDVNEGTFYARILLKMKNELGQKIVELDARPSDSTVLALAHGRPILVAKKVYDAVDDMSEILERVLNQQAASAEEQAESSEEGDEDDDSSSDDEDDDKK